MNKLFELLGITDNNIEKIRISDNEILFLNSKDEEIEWITVNGSHIPIKKGQTKEEAIQEFIDEHAGGGYSDKNESNRAQVARAEGKGTKKELAKELGITQKDAEHLFSDEWHHVGKGYKKTPFYYIDAYIDLKTKGEISKETIEKYNLDKIAIRGINISWNALNQRKKANSSEEILSPYISKYKNDIKLQEIFKYVLDKKKKKVNSIVSTIRGFIEYIQEAGADDSREDLKSRLKRFDKLIKFYSTEEMEKRKKALKK